MKDSLYENPKSRFSARDNRHGRSRLEYPAHLHRQIELVLMIEGHTVAYADFDKYEIEAGDAFIAFPNQIHRYESSGVEKYLILMVDPAMIPSLEEVFYSSLPHRSVIKGGAKDGELLHLAGRLVQLRNEQGPYAAEMLQGYLLAFFSRLLSHLDLGEDQTGYSQTLKSVVTYCIQHHRGELSLAVLERELHVSKYYISHLFSDKLKIGFNEYVNALRVSVACNHLRRTKKPVSEIATLVGFNTQRTFHRAFLKQMKMTPGEYRGNTKKHTKGEK